MIPLLTYEAWEIFENNVNITRNFPQHAIQAQDPLAFIARITFGSSVLARYDKYTVCHIWGYLSFPVNFCSPLKLCSPSHVHHHTLVMKNKKFTRSWITAVTSNLLTLVPNQLPIDFHRHAQLVCGEVGGRRRSRHRAHHLLATFSDRFTHYSVHWYRVRWLSLRYM